MRHAAANAVALALLLLALTACGETKRSAPAGGERRESARLVDLRSTAQLRGVFNARAGEPRLVLLISPT